MQREFQLVYDAIIDRDGLRVSRSPWGPDDVLGRLNWMDDDTRCAALSRVDGRRVFDLAVTYEVGMPCWVEAADPKFDLWMSHTPEGTVLDELSGVRGDVHRRYSYAGSAMNLYTHAGTHLCSLTHFGHHGMFWNGITSATHLGSRGWTVGGVAPPIAATAVMLDIAALHQVDCLPDSYEITDHDLRAAADLQGTPPQTGDIVLIRTGRMSRWSNRDAFLARPPGLGMKAAIYLCEKVGAMCLGVDAGGEAIPSSIPDSYLPVHCYLMATAGTPLFENLMLEELSAERMYQLIFVTAPMKIRGSTGLPTRPLAFARAS